jgi:hypothetical protein
MRSFARAEVRRASDDDGFSTAQRPPGTSGFKIAYSTDRGIVHVRFPTEPTEEFSSRAEARDRSATVASLAPFFTPRSVAVIGASHKRGSIGRMVLERLIHAGFEGPVYPVNPNARSVAAVRAHGSILDVPDSADLAIIAIPTAAVPRRSKYG